MNMQLFSFFLDHPSFSLRVTQIWFRLLELSSQKTAAVEHKTFPIRVPYFHIVEPPVQIFLSPLVVLLLFISRFALVR